MSKLSRILLIGMMLFFGCVSTAFAQSYVFEGTVRDFSDYGAANLSSATVAVYKLDSNMLPQTSGGNLVAATISQYTSTWPVTGNTVTAVSGVFYFVGSDPAYLLKFTSGSKEFEFIWLSQRSSPISVKDFGPAVVATQGSTASTIDTRALSSAVAFLAAHNGGKLTVPTGLYKIGVDYTNCSSCATQTFDGIPLPSGLILEGANPASSSNCVLELQLASKSLFKIGQLTNRITVRDITLRATSYTSTNGIAASGAMPSNPATDPPTGSTEFLFSNITFAGFDRGISIVATDSSHGWQCNNVRIDHCTFGAKYGVYTDTLNTDMHISNVELNVKPSGSGIYVKRAGFMLIENTIGGGITESGVQATNFIFLGMVNTVQIENSECEEFVNALNVDFPSGSGLGSTGIPGPLTLISNAFGLPVLLNRDVSLVSIGNWYCNGNVKAESTGTHVEIYSIGDRACVDPGLSLPGHSECSVPESGECNPFSVTNNNKIAWRSGSNSSFTANKLFGVGTTTPGTGISGTAPSIAEIDGNLPWLILKGPGSTHNRWGWAVYDSKLYLQDIGSANIVTIDGDGKVIPQQHLNVAGTAYVRGSLGDSSNKWDSVYAVNVYTGDTILSDKKTGQQLYRIHEDKDTIIFEDIRTGKEMMRVDRDGNLYVKGRVFQNTDYNQAAKRVKRAPVKKRRARR